jgi:hypothetical protein
VDVHNGHVRASGGEQLQRVRARGGHANSDVLGRVDPGMDSVRLEVEGQRSTLGAGSGVISSAAGKTREQHEKGKESAHRGEQYG